MKKYFDRVPLMNETVLALSETSDLEPAFQGTQAGFFPFGALINCLKTNTVLANRLMNEK